MLKQKTVIRLLAYAAVVNGYIHSEQLLFINRIVRNDEEARKYIYTILLSDETYHNDLNHDFQDIVRHLSEQLVLESRRERNRVKKQMLRIACYDGSFDEKEQELMSVVFPGKKQSRLTIRYHIAHFYRRIRGSLISRLIEKIKSVVFSNATPFYRSRCLRFDGLIKRLTDDNCGIINQALSQIDIYPQLSKRQDKYRKDLNLINRNEAAVAVVGKTKAGKSTLFSLLSKTGDELIGKNGRQRTSKCTVVAHYKGIKIIDTPGLAASAVESVIDERAAMKACGGADGVLFLMPNDTYDYELEFIKKLVYMNKPISILFNYKNSDWFNYHLDELLSDPGIWKKGDANNDLTGWANQLLNYASKHSFNHIFENRIYYSFLLAAKIGRSKTIDLPGTDTKKKVPKKKRKEIYEDSDYEKCISAFFRDFTRKAKMFRLARIVSTSMDYIQDIKSEVETLVCTNDSKLKKVSDSMNHMASATDIFERQCVALAEDVIREVLAERVFLSSEAENSVRKLGNKKFEEYVTVLLKQTGEEICNALIKMLCEETDNVNGSLKTCFSGHRNSTAFAGDYVVSYSMEEKFRTVGSMNLFKTKELYILPMAGLGLLTLMTGNLPAALAISLAKTSAENTIDKKTLSWSSAIDQRSAVRWQEIAILFDKMTSYYKNEIKSYTHIYFEGIGFSDELDRRRNELQDLRERRKNLKNALKYLDEARDRILRDYSVEFLTLCQRRARFIRYALKQSDDCAAPALYIYASNCTEECFNDMRYIIYIKEENTPC